MKLIKLLNPPKYYHHNNEANQFTECMACKYPVLNPVEHVCGSVYCGDCVVDESKVCGECDKGFKGNVRDVKNKIVLNILDTMTVTCMMCSALVKRNDFILHFNEVCEIKCPNGFYFFKF